MGISRRDQRRASRGSCIRAMAFSRPDVEFFRFVECGNGHAHVRGVHGEFRMWT